MPSGSCRVCYPRPYSSKKLQICANLTTHPGRGRVGTCPLPTRGYASACVLVTPENVSQENDSYPCTISVPNLEKQYANAYLPCMLYRVVTPLVHCTNLESEQLIRLSPIMWRLWKLETFRDVPTFFSDTARQFILLMHGKKTKLSVH